MGTTIKRAYREEIPENMLNNICNTVAVNKSSKNKEFLKSNNNNIKISNNINNNSNDNNNYNVKSNNDNNSITNINNNNTKLNNTILKKKINFNQFKIDTIKRERMLQTLTKESEKTFKTLTRTLRDVESQNRCILSQLNERESTLNRFIESTVTDSASKHSTHGLALRIFEAESRHQYNLFKLQEMERRLNFLKSTTQGENLNIDDLKRTILEIETRNNLLQKEFQDAELKIRSLNTHARKENIEISGIPDCVSNRDLELTVLELLRCMDVPLKSCDIVTCHRLPKKNPELSGHVLVRFVDPGVTTLVLRNQDLLKHCRCNGVNINNVSIVGNFSIL